MPKFKYGSKIPAYPLTPLPLYYSKREIIIYDQAGDMDVDLSELYTNVVQQNIPRSGPHPCQRALAAYLGVNITNWLLKKRNLKLAKWINVKVPVDSNSTRMVKPFIPCTLPK